MKLFSTYAKNNQANEKMKWVSQKHYSLCQFDTDYTPKIHPTL